MPTRDRPGPLSVCVAALERQTLPGLGIVVVDDGSRRPADIVAATADSSARLLRLDGRGPAAARNAGARAADAEVVLFSDDDCEPAADWAESLVSTLDSGARAAAGRTINGLPESALAAASHAVLEGVIEAGRDRASGALSFAPTCNLAVRAELLEAIPFDESYPLPAGEDRDWGARLQAHCEGIAWVPAAVTAHRHALSPRSFWGQHYRYGRGAHRFRASHDAGPQAPALLRAVLERSRAAGPRVVGLVALAQLATAAGYAREMVSGGVGPEPPESSGVRRS